MRVVREIEPVKTWQVGEKTWIVDLGQNISGWIGLDFNEPAGTEIRIRCTEMLTENGDVLDNVPASFVSCHAAPQGHRIIADGKPHSWRPYFSYQGFRYAEVSGLGKAPTSGQIRGLVVNTDAPVNASFKSSEPLLDRIFQMGIQTHHNNMHSILEDCPHREKCLWGGDAHSSWATGFYTLDSGTFYRQQVRLFYTPPFDPKGIPGRIGVGKRSTNKTLDFTWSVSPLFLAWRNYQINGDLQSPADFYDLMLTFLKVTEKDSTKLMPNLHRYGDHAPPIGIERPPGDPELIAGLNFFAAAKRFAVFADELGKKKDAEWSRNLAERIRQSIIENYYDSEKNTFGNGTHDSLALEFGVLDTADQKKLAATLAKTYQDNGKKFDGGFMSYFIYPQLTENGHVDLALEMLLNPDYPGIAQSIRDYDATTIFERYNSESLSAQLRQSLDHHAMNHPTAWMLNYLAGIRIHTDEPGSRRLLLQPYIPADLDWVEGEKETPYGTVKSAWKQTDGSVSWTFTIPPNSVANVQLPTRIKNLQAQGEKVTNKKRSFELVAGNYTLEWTRVD
jgi:alpha-L-rhamnosidase